MMAHIQKCQLTTLLNIKGESFISRSTLHCNYKYNLYITYLYLYASRHLLYLFQEHWT